MWDNCTVRTLCRSPDTSCPLAELRLITTPPLISRCPEWRLILLVWNDRRFWSRCYIAVICCFLGDVTQLYDQSSPGCPENQRRLAAQCVQCGCARRVPCDAVTGECTSQKCRRGRHGPGCVLGKYRNYALSRCRQWQTLTEFVFWSVAGGFWMAASQYVWALFMAC